jgi:hypothetical protein
MISEFLSSYTVENNMTLETIKKDFHKVYPKNSCEDLVILLLTHGHEIQDGVITSTNETKILEFLKSYTGTSLGLFAYDYRVWRNTLYKIRLDFEKVRQFLKENTTRSWSSGDAYLGTNP